MDITPVDPGDLSASRVNNAQTHGRNTADASISSQSKATEPQLKANNKPEPPHEIPVDLAAEHIDTSLRKAYPGLDPFLAARIAKQLADYPQPVKWDTPKPANKATDGSSDTAPHLDTQA